MEVMRPNTVKCEIVLSDVADVLENLKYFGRSEFIRDLKLFLTKLGY